MRIAFWNTNKKSFTTDLLNFIVGKDIDILILAEATLSGSHLIQTFRKQYPTKAQYYNHIVDNKKFKIITRVDVKNIENFDTDYGGKSWTINKFKFSNKISFSIVSVHLPSKIHWDSTSQIFETIRMMQIVREYEKKHGLHTIVIGDFNMNPYEPGMVASSGLHGMNDKNIAMYGKKGRIVQGEFYSYLYNPMWNYLGDSNNAPGTYHYQKAIHYMPTWNTFDQVLIRPQLLTNFVHNDVTVIDKIGSKNLINPLTGAINKKISDHLPILLNLNL